MCSKLKCTASVRPFKRTFMYKSASNYSTAILWLFLCILIVCVTEITSRKITSSSDSSEPIQITLGHKKNSREKVSVFSTVILRCNFDNPSWFKNSNRYYADRRRTKFIRFEKIKKSDAGTYACMAENGEWSNLTLSVLPGENRKSFYGDDKYNDFAMNMEIESQIKPDNTDAVDDETDDYFEKTTTILDEEEDHTYEPNELENSNNEESTPEPHDGETDEAPYFTKPNNLVKLMAKPSGNMMRLRCLAGGFPIPVVTWTKNNERIVRNMGDVKYLKWAIILEDLVPQDSGIYTCHACNTHGCISFSTKLEVKDRYPGKPNFKDGYPKNVTALVNSTAILECPTLSDLQAHIEWAKIRAFNDSDQSILQKNVTKLERDSESQETLRLENVTYDSEGWYTCYAATSLGHSTASAYLHVVDELPEDPISLPVRSHPMWINIVVIILMALFIVAIGIMFLTFKKLKKEKLMKHRVLERINQWTKKVIILEPNPENAQCIADAMVVLMPIIKIEKHRTTMVQNANGEAPMIAEYEFPLDLNWEFPRTQLDLGKTLGEGAFGKVVIAEAHGLMKSGTSTIVAVKMLKEGHTDGDVLILTSEMTVMKQIGKHINIINLLGVCTQNGPLFVIVEFAPHGNLRDFLRKHRNTSFGYEITLMDDEKPSKTLTHKDLVSFAYQVARGMEYLASRRCIHRDLAARNVLVSDDYVMKIADFGLARDIKSQDYYRKTTEGLLPVKWMSPESIFEKMFDTRSDVWSYGILLWEIMTLGGNPYPSVVSTDHLIELLRRGERMEKPPQCSNDIYIIMRECWSHNPHVRPKFSDIVENLDKILSITSNDEYLDLGLPQLETPPSSDGSDMSSEFPRLL